MYDALMQDLAPLVLQRERLTSSLSDTMVFIPRDTFDRMNQEGVVAIVREEIAELDQQIVARLQPEVLAYVGRIGIASAVSAILETQPAEAVSGGVVS